MPIAASGQRTARLIKNAGLVVTKNGLHGVIWTHSEEVNHGLEAFLKLRGRAHRSSESKGKWPHERAIWRSSKIDSYVGKRLRAAREQVAACRRVDRRRSIADRT